MTFHHSRTIIEQIERMLVERASESFSQVAPDLIQWLLDEILACLNLPKKR